MDKKTENQNNSAQPQQPEGQAQKPGPFGLRWGRGVYGSKDVPIKLLDRVIAVLILITVALTAYFSLTGGYTITFDSMGGSEVESQRLRYGNRVEVPQEPTRPGYDFTGWYTSEGTVILWDFSEDQVESSMTLYAGWSQAAVLVKLDLDGGTLNGQTEAEPIQGTFGEPYGPLPTPEKQGATFAGWQYSGQIITAESIIQTNGEHVLTALWNE